MKKVEPRLEIIKGIFTMYKNIKHLREKNGLTTKQMAKIIEIDDREANSVGSLYGCRISL